MDSGTHNHFLEHGFSVLRGFLAGSELKALRGGTDVAVRNRATFRESA